MPFKESAAVSRRQIKVLGEKGMSRIRRCDSPVEVPLFTETFSISLKVAVKVWICSSMLKPPGFSGVRKHALELKFGDCWENREKPFRLRSPADGIGHPY